MTWIADLFSSFICNHFNYCVSKREFPNEMKNDRYDKTNY